MATCYLCGTDLAGKRVFRRRVKTGEKVSRRYPRTQVNHQVSNGYRSLCRRCAVRGDEKRAREALWGHVSVLIAIGVLVLLLLFHQFP